MNQFIKLGWTSVIELNTPTYILKVHSNNRKMKIIDYTTVCYETIYKEDHTLVLV